MKRFAYDITDQSVSSGGIDGALWPVQHHDIVAVRDEFCGAALPLLKDAIAGGDRNAEMIGLLFSFLLGDVMGLYRAQAVLSRLRLQDAELTGLPDPSYFAPLLCGDMPPENAVIARMRNVAPTSIARESARLIKDGLSKKDDWWFRRPFQIANKKDGVISIALCPMTQHHALALGEKIQFIAAGDWFGNLNKDKGQGPNNLAGESLPEEIVTIIEKVFASGGETLGDRNRHYFSNWLSEGVSLVDRHYSALLAKPEWIPERLWTGTAGNIWARLLRKACRYHGGETVAHDHAGGMALFETPSDSVLEFIELDRFLVWSEHHVTSAHENLRPDWILQDRPPEIEVVPGSGDESSSNLTVRSEPDRKNVRTVMVVATVFSLGRVPFTPLPAPLPMMDWHARLIAALMKAGMEVIYKPHPESPMDACKGISELGCTIERGRFEDVCHDCDVAIFDVPQGTAFTISLQKNVPMVLADFEIHKFVRGARIPLAKRVAVLTGDIDIAGRYQVDWESLVAAIDEAPQLRDQALLNIMMAGR